MATYLLMSQAKGKMNERKRSSVTTAKSTTDDDLRNIDEAIAANEESDGEAEQPQPSKPRTRRRANGDGAKVAPPVMPHPLKSFTSRELPWMKIGDIGEPAATAMEAAERGGLNFEIELLDAGFRSSQKPPPGKSPWMKVDQRRACVRKDTQQFFSYVSSTYAPVQYGEAFAFMDKINPRYLAAGMLGGGRQGFMVVQLPEHDTLDLSIGQTSDKLVLYVVLRTSHDLTRAIEVSVMSLRDKCMNALTLNTFTQGAAQRWSVKHVGKDPMAKMAAAASTLTRVNAYVEALDRTARELGAIKLEMDGAVELLQKILPNRPRRDEQINAITHAWQHSEANGHIDNGWGLVNAVSEYFEWGRNEGTRTDQSRFTSGLTGSTHKYTNRVAQLLLRRR